uniref:hypothetical protein n=1 Tax=Pseudomonas sp. TaxID=306 RepID=UPI0010B0A7BD|nr:hypothetical protein [Pseudomonas sp.]QBM91764.1 hypothetical protein pA7BH1_p04 [Pseudomonas sp.]
MTDRFDPAGSYDVINPDGSVLGEVVKGVFYQDGKQWGRIDGDHFESGGSTGTVKGLSILRSDGVVFQLKLKQAS